MDTDEEPGCRSVFIRVHPWQVLRVDSPHALAQRGKAWGEVGVHGRGGGVRGGVWGELVLVGLVARSIGPLWRGDCERVHLWHAEWQALNSTSLANGFPAREATGRTTRHLLVARGPKHL